MFLVASWRALAKCWCAWTKWKRGITLRASGVSFEARICVVSRRTSQRRFCMVAEWHMFWCETIKFQEGIWNDFGICWTMRMSHLDFDGTRLPCINLSNSKTVWPFFSAWWCCSQLNLFLIIDQGFLIGIHHIKSFCWFSSFKRFPLFLAWFPDSPLARCGL